MNSIYTIYVPDRLGTGTLIFTDYGHQAPGTRHHTRGQVSTMGTLIKELGCLVLSAGLPPTQLQLQGSYFCH